MSDPPLMAWREFISSLIFTFLFGLENPALLVSFKIDLGVLIGELPGVSL